MGGAVGARGGYSSSKAVRVLLLARLSTGRLRPGGGLVAAPVCTERGGHRSAPRPILVFSGLGGGSPGGVLREARARA